MCSLGFQSCITQPCVFHHPEKDLRVVTHVDDFLCGGPKENLKWLRKSLQKEFELKSEILGNGHDDVQDATFLGRSIKWRKHGIEIEGDSKHVQLLLKEWDMETCRPVSSPGTADEKTTAMVNGRDTTPERPADPMPPEAATRYRRAAARLNYMSLDRMDLSFAAKEIARSMAKPFLAMMRKLKGR